MEENLISLVTSCKFWLVVLDHHLTLMENDKITYTKIAKNISAPSCPLFVQCLTLFAKTVFAQFTSNILVLRREEQSLKLALGQP